MDLMSNVFDFLSINRNLISVLNNKYLFQSKSDQKVIKNEFSLKLCKIVLKDIKEVKVCNKLVIFLRTIFFNN